MKLFYAAALTVGILTTQAAAKTVKHTIKKGETLYTIAHKNHTTIEQLRQVNGIQKGEILKIGRELAVPTNTYFPEDKIVGYEVKKGDTLSTIARKYSTDIETLKKINSLKDSTIRVGKTIKIPQNTKTVKLANQKAPEKKVASSTLPTTKVDQKVKKQKDTFALNSLFPHSNNKKTKPNKIVNLAKKKLGHKYVWGAVGKKGTFDCSGFTQFCYRNSGIDIPRTSILQSKYGKFVKKDELKVGDLIFFDTSKKHRGYVNHVGIYIGDNKFIHASSARKKVVITYLRNFYAQRYMGARRPL